MNICRLLACVLALALVGGRATQAQDWVYQAQPDDTLWDICLEYTAKRGCWLELGKYNGIANAQRLQPGTEIRIPVEWLLELPIVGSTLNVRGDVRYQEQSGSNPVALREGQQLVLGGVITTLDGTAKIALGDYSEIFVRPNSVLELSSMSVGASPAGVTRLRLDRGNIEVRVTPGSRSRFEVHTPSAIAAVRGTRYRVANASRDSMRSEVLTGLVAISADTQVDVPAGFGLLAREGESLGAPRKLLDPPQFEVARIDAPLPVVLAWERDPLALKWQLDLYDASGGLVSSVLTTTAGNTYEELAEGCYQLVARAIDSDGFNGLESELPVCVEPAPEPEPEEENHLGFILWLVLAIGMLI